MEDLYINFTVSIARLNKLVQKIKSFEINKFGLHPIHVSCGYYLSKNPEGLTAKELCDMSLDDKAAISRALKTLQERGIVEYSPKGRNEIVKLTSEGQKLASIISERINAAVKAGSVNLTNKQREFFYNSLLDISDNLIKYYENLTKKEEYTK